MWITLVGKGKDYHCDSNVVKIIKAKFPVKSVKVYQILSQILHLNLIYSHSATHLDSRAENNIFEVPPLGHSPCIIFIIFVKGRTVWPFFPQPA